MFVSDLIGSMEELKKAIDIASLAGVSEINLPIENDLGSEYNSLEQGEVNVRLRDGYTHKKILIHDAEGELCLHNITLDVELYNCELSRLSVGKPDIEKFRQSSMKLYDTYVEQYRAVGIEDAPTLFIRGSDIEEMIFVPYKTYGIVLIDPDRLYHIRTLSESKFVYTNLKINLDWFPERFREYVKNKHHKSNCRVSLSSWKTKKDLAFTLHYGDSYQQIEKLPDDLKDMVVDTFTSRMEYKMTISNEYIVKEAYDTV